MNKNLANFFNVPLNDSKETKAIAGGTFDSSNFQKDYEKAQQNIKDLIGNGNIKQN
jgi:hypothetical protein